MVVEILGVVKLRPDPSSVPPVDALYQSIDSVAGTVAEMVTVPGPHLVKGPVPAVGAAGALVTVAVIAVLVADIQVPVVLLVSA